MAWFETWFKNDLAKPINVVQLQGVMFNLDNLANKIGVELEYNGQPAALEGTIAGYVIRNDGTTLNLTTNTGKEGNKAWVILPQEAYTVEGPISIVIKLVYNSAETTIGACAGYVTRSRTSSEIAPTGTVIPSLASLEAAIAAANAAAANAADATDYIAPTEEDNTASAAHAVGSYFIYDGKMMKATSAIAQGSMIVPYASGVTGYNCAEEPNGLSGAVYDVTKTAIRASNNAADAQRLVAPVESMAGSPTSVATMAHATGSNFVFGGVLYKATADIAIGDPIVITGTGANAAEVPGGVTGEVEALSGEVTDLKSAIDVIDVLPGSTKLSGTDISAATGDVTYSVDPVTGAITITNGSTGEYANVRTASNFVQKYLTIGNTYRVYVDAEVASGTPELHVAVRGVNGDTSGIAKRANLTNTMQGVLDFTVDEYMRDIAIFVAYGTSTRYSSVIIKSLTLVRYDVSGQDVIARNDIKKLSSMFVDSIIDGDDFEPTQTGITLTVDSETGDITVTNASSGNYANIATKDATFTQKLTIGATYRLHAKAEILSGFPNMRIAIRGTAGGEQSVATYVPLTAENNEGFVDFVATKYMKRVTIFMANGSSTRNSSARFSEVWLKKIKDPEPYIVPPFFTANKPLFRAHNGDEINAPSATMPAFKLACERGYKMIQIARVRQSADGTWYVMHNATIDETTNGTGSIASLTDEYLATVHIDTGNNVDQYTDDELRIPKLSDVLALCRRYGVYPSIRFGSLPSTANTDANLAIWNSLFAEVAKYNPMLCMFSGEMNEIRTLKALQPNYYGEIYDSDGTHIDSYLSECISKGYKGICIMSQYSYFTAAQISDIHEAGYQVAVYPGTTWTDDQVIAAVDAGIDIYQDTGTRPDVPIQGS